MNKLNVLFTIVILNIIGTVFLACLVCTFIVELRDMRVSIESRLVTHPSFFGPAGQFNTCEPVKLTGLGG